MEEENIPRDRNYMDFKDKVSQGQIQNPPAASSPLLPLEVGIVLLIKNHKSIPDACII